MAYKNIFVDSDVLLDLLLRRQPFEPFSQILLQQGLNGSLSLKTSTLIFANIHYMVAKNLNRQVAKEQLKVLTKIVDPLAFESDDIKKALDNEHADFEDTIQYFIAEKNQCDLIISRNIKHYKKFPIPVLTAEQFLRTL
ncbi:PIN domain-containing protein [Mucilaginibacter corticis]|uniref:PIN domain-containing protein n=1 Tax=Mucilaginibacter corticis TaxID=2597670 RepID=A0A556MW11_9SPHI|nr:PIN domain-containing protein [Mucilaginibacter corticis]TSJ44124.1 PIN domain-containing protein [Mucilaginibacter corticis]